MPFRKTSPSSGASIPKSPRKGILTKLKSRVPHITKQLFLAKHSLIRFPWVKANTREMDELHKLGSKLGRYYQTRSDVLLSFLWPVQALISAFLLPIEQGNDVKRAYGISRRKQLGQCLKFALRHNFPAEYYYKMRIWRDHQRVDLYVHFYEHSPLCRWINEGKDVETFDNKQIFFEACIDLGRQEWE